ncbi:MAG: lysyl oxidase family protein, partial [Planctomycetota bacterium]
GASECAVLDGRVGAPGLRRLLRFDTVTVNYGDADLVLGDPASPEPPLLPSDFEQDPCDGRTRLLGWARYELLDASGAAVVVGHDQSICLQDSYAVLGGAPGGSFDCGFQGLSAGWANLCAKTDTGQWVDVTGLPRGSYVLQIAIDVAGRFDEGGDVRPNTVRRSVHLPPPGDPLLTPGSVDVTVDPLAIEDSLEVRTRFFPVGHCALVEGSVGGPGVRRLLLFDTVIVNYGEEDVVVGDPQSPEPPLLPSDFEYSPCHDHHHFGGWTEYELWDSTGTFVVAAGHKQSFCLIDSIPYSILPSHEFDDCDFQGISSGWGDVYDKSLDGQWVDITDVPAGDYLLVVTVNAEGKIVEADDRHPNRVGVPVAIP